MYQQQQYPQLQQNLQQSNLNQQQLQPQQVQNFSQQFDQIAQNQGSQYGQGQIQSGSGSLPSWATQRVSGQPYFQNAQYPQSQQMNQYSPAQMGQMGQMNQQIGQSQMQAGLPSWATQPVQGQPNFQTGQVYGQGQQSSQQLNQGAMMNQMGQFGQGQMQSAGLPSWATQPVQGQPNFQTGQVYGQGQGQQASQQLNQGQLNQQYGQGQSMQSAGLPSWTTQPVSGQPYFQQY